jgi:hypothetical protein
MPTAELIIVKQSPVALLSLSPLFFSSRCRLSRARVRAHTHGLFPSNEQQEEANVLAPLLESCGQLAAIAS